LALIYLGYSSIIGRAMVVPSSEAWKLALAIALGAAILMGAWGAAPRRSVPRTELRRLVACALLLYGVGALASLTDHATLAAIAYASGISVCALALWLSRGSDADDPPRGGDDPSDEQPPPAPDGMPDFDWNAFEREFRSYARRSSGRTPAGAR
jgi:hypothetical protein